MNLNVFLVDDDRVTLMINERIIQNSYLRLQPTAFLNAKDALKFILNNNSSENGYVIFLDINMPEMNGWEFLDTINRLQLSVQILVVMVTSSIDTSDKEKAKTYPQVIDFMEKPIKINTIDGLKHNFQLSKLIKAAC